MTRPAITHGERFILAFLAVIATSAVAQELPLPVADLDRSTPVDFANEIMPIFKKNCLACHHANQAEGGLVLETIDGLRTGGDSGPAVVAGNPGESLLLARVRGIEEPLMPPEDNEVRAQTLTSKERGLLKLWIEQGARVRETASQQSIAWQPPPDSIRSVYAIDVSPDGQLAAIGRGHRVSIVDLSSQTPVASLVDASLGVDDAAGSDLVHAIAFSPDAQRIATGGFRTVRVWRKEPRAVDPQSHPFSEAAGLIAAGPDQHAVAFVNAIGDIEVWDLAQNARLHVLPAAANPLTGLAWPADSDRIFSCDLTGNLVVWQASSGKKLREHDLGAAVVELSVSRQANRAAVIDTQGQARLFRIAADSSALEDLEVEVLAAVGANVVTFADKPAPMMIVARQDGTVDCIDLDRYKRIQSIDPGAVVDALAVTHDQSKLITGGRDGTTNVWNLADGQRLITLVGDLASELEVGRMTRDAERLEATLSRLDQRTPELESLLAKESERLSKVTAERDQVADAVAAEDKKRRDAIASVTASEAKIADANEQTRQAEQAIADARTSLQTQERTIKTLSQQITTASMDLEAALKELAAVTRSVNAAELRVDRIRNSLGEMRAAAEQAEENAGKARREIESGTTAVADANSQRQAATKELDAQRKAVAAADEAQRKHEVLLASRQQALESTASAHERAAHAIPIHQARIESESRRRDSLKSALSRRQQQMSGPGNEVTGIAISGDDTCVATAHSDGSVRLHRIDNGLSMGTFQSADRRARSRVVFLGDVICGFGPGQIPAIWSRQTVWRLERKIGSINDPSTISDRATALDFRPDGKTLAVGSGPPSRIGDVKMFSVQSGRLVRDFGEIHSDSVLALRFSPDGRHLASAAADKTVRLLDVAGGSVIRSLEGHTHHVLSIAWRDDAQSIVSASADHTVKVWEVESGEQQRTIRGFSKEIVNVDFVGTSNQFVAAGADGQLRLHDSTHGRTVRKFDASGDFLFTACVTPDGEKLLAAGQSGIVRIWAVADGKLLHTQAQSANE